MYTYFDIVNDEKVSIATNECIMDNINIIMSNIFDIIHMECYIIITKANDHCFEIQMCLRDCK